MSSESEVLLGVLEKFNNTPMLVVGDLILDHYVWGKVNRISPEAPVVVVRVTEENKRLGGAGNVVKNLVALGARVRICGVIGDDDAGREMLSLFHAARVDADGVVVDPTRQTTIKTRVIAHAQQVVRVDREETSPLAKPVAQRLGEKTERQILGVRGIALSDYAKGVVCPEVLNCLAEHYQNGELGFGKIPLIIDPKGPNYSVYGRATVMKPNRGEAEAASGMEIRNRPQAIAAGRKLLGQWNAEMILLTLGEEGMVLVSNLPGIAEAVEIDTVAREVYDVSGAGDTVSAVFSLALAVGAKPQEAAELANIAAGIVVAEIGTVAVTTNQIAEAIAAM